MKPSRRDRLKPVEYLAFAGGIGIFSALVVLLVIREPIHALIIGGVAFIVSLVVIATLTLVANPPTPRSATTTTSPAGTDAMTMAGGRMRLLAACALAGTALLAGCQSVGVADPATGTAPDGPYLQTADAIFDPVADDVAGTEACDGVAGREALEVFDRVAWPELDVAAGEATLTCGNANGAGWRHIADGHTGDFGELADEVGSSWEDVAWFAIDQALEAPTSVEEYRDDIVNYDVRVELVGDTGDVERAWIVTVGYGLSSSSIITSFPDEVDP